MKIPKGRLPLSLMAVVISAVAFTGLIFTEDLRALTGTSILKLTACCRKDDAVARSSKVSSGNDVSEERDNMSVLDDDIVDEDKTGFSAGECSVTEGRWVFNRSQEPLYSHQKAEREEADVCGGLAAKSPMAVVRLPRPSSDTARTQVHEPQPIPLSSDWHNRNGIKCYNETEPVRERGYWGSGSDRRIMQVVAGVVGRMRVPATFLNITQLSEHRIDGHTSVYTEFQGKILSEEQKANPLRYADCIHWCLPGVPDTWNQLLYAYL
ncbi:hypothetical protein B296_00022075 [Ensete ventricosum]|uniref:Trichome birefringence-like C-terminal domain-containing protein n=1 Tax=Ensete ventricosum TaxID=4639 RepID=A0A427A619_ENSVE|nr:hypothetical protein B296_00022075 [Ensete ventricosum]